MNLLVPRQYCSESRIWYAFTRGRGVVGGMVVVGGAWVVVGGGIVVMGTVGQERRIHDGLTAWALSEGKICN